MKRVLRVLLVFMVLLAALPAIVATAATKYEAFTYTSPTGQIMLYSGTRYGAQTFVPSTGHLLDHLVLCFARDTGSPALTSGSVQIYATDGASKPTGAALETISVPDWTVIAAGGDIHTFTASGTLWLAAGVKYAIVVKASGGDASHRLWFLYSSTASYGGGESWYSYDSGSTWTTTGAGVDFFFEDWGTGSYALPAVYSGASSNQDTFTTLSGSVTAVGTSNTTSWGMQWGTSTGNYTANVTVTGSTGSTFSWSSNTTALTPGTTYYWRAFAADSAGTSYATERSFDFRAGPTVTTDDALYAGQGGTGAYYGLWGNVLSSGYGGNVTARGVHLGTTSGVWSLDSADLYLDGSAAPGSFVRMASGLSSNTTYYYQAWATYYVGPTQFYGAGSIKSFTTPGTSADPNARVLTVGAEVSYPGGEWGDAQVARMYGSIAANTNMTERGFHFGSSNTSLISTVRQIAGISVGSFNMDSGGYAVPNPFFFQAYAKDAAGATYNGTIMSIDWSVGSPRIEALTAEVFGDQALLVGNIVATGGYSLVYRGFSWGTTADADDYGMSEFAGPGGVQADPFGLGQFSMHEAQQLLPNTTYYWKAGAKSATGDWVWSSSANFTTSGHIPGVTALSPELTTDAVWNIKTTSFSVSGTIQAVGGDNLTLRGFQWSFIDGEWSPYQVWTESGNFSTGNFSASLSGFGNLYPIVYVRSVGYNRFGVGYGDPRIWVRLFNANTDTPGTSDSHKPANAGAYLRGILQRLGMDNEFGHWASMGILMLIVCIIMVIMILVEKDRIVKRITAFMALVVCVVIAGAYLFGGMLNPWLVFALVVLVAGIITVFAGNVLNTGKAAGGG